MTLKAASQYVAGYVIAGKYELEEELGVPRVKVERAVQYIDHNVVQLDYKNPDDHRMLQALARKYGLRFSRPGNGISHYIHMERYGKPGQTMLGADSHTTQAGCLGMIAIGAGGLDVAVQGAQPLPDHGRADLGGTAQRVAAEGGGLLQIAPAQMSEGHVGLDQRPGADSPGFAAL